MKDGNVIILYGPIAAGKLTIAKLLAEKLGYKLTHNHLINDLVRSLYDRDTGKDDEFIEELRFRFFEEVAKSRINIVSTHTYAHDFVSATGMSDPEYMRKLEKLFEKHSINVHFIHLKASNEKLLDRLENPSRDEFKKLTDRKIMEELLKSKDFETSAPVKNNIVVDNTNLTPEETASVILEKIIT